MEGHTLNIDNREKITVTAVTDVDSFNEETVLVVLQKGSLIIKGKNLHLHKLDLGEGKAVLTGSVQSAVYTEKTEKKAGNLLKRIFK